MSQATEREILKEINEYTQLNFKKKKYPYSRYDASNEIALLEIKDRGNDVTFDDLFIEFDKFAYNRTYSLLTNRDFWYANRVNQEIYVWNISDLIKENYKFNWQWLPLPSDTDFGRGGIVDKFVGVVFKKDAKHSFKCETLEKIK